jgi:uncharacterized protein DUF4019
MLTAPLALGLLLTSCGSAKNIQMAKQGVDQFHADLDRERYQAMYDAADKGLHQTTTEADFVRLLQAVHRKLGNVQSSQFRNFQVGYSTGQGAIVDLEYQTNFAGGTGTEQFEWRVVDNHATLFGYHVNSNALVEK